MAVDFTSGSPTCGELYLVPAEREGYVPNVLYSCGGLINRGTGDAGGGTLVLPYGFSDHGIRIALISVPALLAEMRNSGSPPPVL